MDYLWRCKKDCMYHPTWSIKRVLFWILAFSKMPRVLLFQADIQLPKAQAPRRAGPPQEPHSHPAPQGHRELDAQQVTLYCTSPALTVLQVLSAVLQKSLTRSQTSEQWCVQKRTSSVCWAGLVQDQQGSTQRYPSDYSSVVLHFSFHSKPTLESKKHLSLDLIKLFPPEGSKGEKSLLSGAALSLREKCKCVAKAQHCKHTASHTHLNKHTLLCVFPSSNTCVEGAVKREMTSMFNLYPSVIWNLTPLIYKKLRLWWDLWLQFQMVLFLFLHYTSLVYTLTLRKYFSYLLLPLTLAP